jgi:hypothetical protein
LIPFLTENVIFTFYKFYRIDVHQPASVHRSMQRQFLTESIPSAIQLPRSAKLVCCPGRATEASPTLVRTAPSGLCFSNCSTSGLSDVWLSFCVF